MQKYLWIVFVVGGLWFAKTRFIDPPKPKVRTKAEIAAEMVGRIKSGKPVSAQEIAAIAPAAATDTAQAQSMIASLQAMLGVEKTPAQKAEERFREFMRLWESGGVSESDDAQAAACMWSRGSKVLSGEEINTAGTFFDIWRHKGGVYVETIQYDIKYFTPKTDHVVAVVSINGKTFQIGVPYSANPLFWIE